MTRARDLADGAANVFSAADNTKLDGIETAATADQTNAEIRTAVEAASDSNVFTDADHSKLDGIETAATADQTASEIKTAYESNSDTNAFTDADHSKLDGIEAAADVTDTTNVASAGALMTHVSGTQRYAFGGLNGNSKFTIEPSSSAGSGAGGAFLKFQGSNGTPVDIAAIDGSMTNGSSGSESGELYFYTKNSGNLINAMTVKNNDSVFIKGKLDVGSIGASGGATGEVAFGGISGSIDGFRIHNTGGNYLELRAASSGNAVRITNTGKMGLNKTPNDKLDIHSGDIRLQNADQTFNDHSQAQGIQWTQETDADVARIEASRHAWGHAPHNLNFYTRDDASNMQKRMIIDYKGRVTMPYHPVFSAYRSGADVADGTVIVFNNTTANVGSHYNTSNGRFTAPVTGNYFFSVFAMSTANSSVFGLRMRLNGTPSGTTWAYNNESSGFHTLSMGFVIGLNATDYVEIMTQGGAMHGIANYHNNFCGYLVG
jgi:hypothetical protein